MRLINVRRGEKAYREQVMELYRQAFPEVERKPEEVLEMLEEQGKMEILALEDAGTFAGLAINMIYGDTALLDYFAVAAGRRGQGLGSAAIRMLLERFRDKKYIFEIEIQDEHAPNARERRRRKDFYLRNGLRETGLFANIYYTDFEILTPDGSLTYEEYIRMLTSVLGEEGVRQLAPKLISEGTGGGENERDDQI